MAEEQPLAEGDAIGRARRIEDARGRYIHAIKQSLPPDMRLDGLKIVVDCAHGAAYTVAPTAIWELGAEVVAIGVSPNGTNINDGVGSTSLEAISRRVVDEQARHRHRARRRRRPADRDRREGPRGRRRPDHGADRHPHGGQRRAQGRRRGRHGDVEPRARAPAQRLRARPGPHQGRRPLRARGDARGRLQRRRRAVGAHDPARPRHHRRRLHRRAAGARRAGPLGQARRASCCTCSIRCRSCSRTWSTRAATRSPTRKSRRRSPRARPRSPAAAAS